MIQFLISLLPRPFRWLSKLVGSGDPRVHATITVMIAFTLCVGFLALIYALLKWHPVIAELTVVTTAITTLASIIYARGKKADEKKEEPGA